MGAGNTCQTIWVISHDTLRDTALLALHSQYFGLFFLVHVTSCYLLLRRTCQCQVAEQLQTSVITKLSPAISEQRKNRIYMYHIYNSIQVETSQILKTMYVQLTYDDYTNIMLKAWVTSV